MLPSKNSGVGVFSLEMSAEQLTLRLLSTESGIDHQKIRNATISSEEWIALTHVAAELGEMKLFIDDTCCAQHYGASSKGSPTESKA